MARIAGVDIPREKRIEIALTYIFGIGLTRSREVLGRTGVNPDTRVKNLTEAEITKLRDDIEKTYKVEGDLKSEIGQNIKRLMELAPTGASVTAVAFLCVVNAPRPMHVPAKVPARPSPVRRKPRGSKGDCKWLNLRATPEPSIPPSPHGRAYIHASYNNTIVTITDMDGLPRMVLRWHHRFQRQQTPFAAQLAAADAVKKEQSSFNMTKVEVVMHGPDPAVNRPSAPSKPAALMPNPSWMPLPFPTTAAACPRKRGCELDGSLPWSSC